MMQAMFAAEADRIAEGARREESQDDLADSARLEGTMGKVAMQPDADSDRRRQEQDRERPLVHRAKAEQGKGERGQVQQNE